MEKTACVWRMENGDGDSDGALYLLGNLGTTASSSAKPIEERCDTCG